MDYRKITISVDGKEYPCYATMGAAVQFRQETGRDIEDMHGTADFAVYIYCCAKSASRREHVDFNYSVQDFCDAVLIDDLNKLSADMNAAAGNSGNDSDGEKKKE